MVRSMMRVPTVAKVRCHVVRKMGLAEKSKINAVLCVFRLNVPSGR